MATYLEVVNNVLCRLREPSASSVQSSSYTKLLGELVNDAKRFVEDAYQWSVLFSEQQISTVADTEAYDLSGTTERSTVYSIIASDGTKVLASLQPPEYQYRKYARYNNQSGAPEYYKVDAGGTSGVLQVSLLPVPSAAVNYQVLTCDPQANMGDTDDDTEISVPWEPIALRAFAYALKERGEDQGQSTVEAMLQFEQSLARAISMDQRNHPPKIWQVI